MLMNAFWYILPLIIAFVAIAPRILNASRNGEFNINAPTGHINPDGNFLHDILINSAGNRGLYIFSIFTTLLIAYGIFKLAKKFNAPLWARSAAASLYVVLPVFNLAPSLHKFPDAGLFAGLCIWLAYLTIKAVRTGNTRNLAIAFAVSVITSWFSPISIWPPFLVFILAQFATDAFKRVAKYGLISSLCWGPFIFLAKKFIALAKVNGTTNSENVKIMLHDMVTNSENLAKDAAGNGLMLIGYLPSMLPLLLLIGLAIFALVQFGYKERKILRVFAAVIVIFITYSIIAILGGNLIITRMLLDPLLLAIITSLANYNYKNFVPIIERAKNNIAPDIASKDTIVA